MEQPVIRNLSAICSGLFLASAALSQQSKPATVDEGRWFRNVRQITNKDMGLDKAGEAYFSADARRICFQAVPHGQTEYQIYVLDLDSGKPEMVSTGQGATTCSFFHPDGKRMLFSSNHLDLRPAETPEEVKKAAEKAGKRGYAWSFFPGMDVFEYTFATKSLKKLTDAEGYDAEASYSPDGKLIVFTSMRDNDQEVYIMDSDGQHARRITHKPGYDGGPFFSPDGKRIVYRSDRSGDGNMQIFVNNLEGTAEHKISSEENVLNWCPYWHPSGKWLIFTRGQHPSDGPPIYDLYLLRDDGSQRLQVTSDPAFDGLPVFSNDGKKLMWTSKRGGLDAAQIFIADFVGLKADGSLTTGAE